VAVVSNLSQIRLLAALSYRRTARFEKFHAATGYY
jgi:hypothetical protein